MRCARLAVLLGPALGLAEQGDDIPLWPGGAPNETKGFPADPESRTGDDGKGCGANPGGTSGVCDHVNNVHSPSLTPFLVNNGTGAAVVVAPGGGYHALAWTKEGLDIAAMYNSLGVSAFVLKYRVPARPNVPFGFAPLQDAQRAIGLIRAGAKDGKWNISATQVGFTGFSAGGHLTAHISTAWRERAYPRVDAADDESCRPDFSLLIYPWSLLKSGDGVTQPLQLKDELNVTKDNPVSFFALNEDDNTANPYGSIAYHLKMLKEGAPKTSFHMYPKGGHGFGLCQTMKSFEECCDWPKAAQRFLQGNGFAPGWPKTDEP